MLVTMAVEGVLLVVYAFYAPARVAVASVMCGFAVFLAFIIAFQIVPKYYDYAYGKREHSGNDSL